MHLMRYTCISHVSAITLIIILYTHCSLAQVLLCSDRYGTPLARSSCQQTLSHMPRGSLPSIFTTRPRTPTNNYEHVPQRWVDNIFDIPTCAITVDLDGHSINDVFVLVPWDTVRLVAQEIIDECVEPLYSGGMATFGLNHSFESVIHPTPYDPRINPIRVATVDVLNPDGTIDSVAVPAGSEDGISKLYLPYLRLFPALSLLLFLYCSIMTFFAMICNRICTLIPHQQRFFTGFSSLFSRVRMQTQLSMTRVNSNVKVSGANCDTILACTY